MKMKRKSQAPSDFKRIKAKVGKRALKPANETDTTTSFKSVHVGQQNVERSEATVVNVDAANIVSTRGRSLDDIVSHLRHPSSTVRISAARGLKDAVTRQHVTSALIRAHLAILMPVCAKLTVDEDGEARQLALEILREVITRASSTDTSTGDAKNSTSHVYLKPFVPLLAAHVASALNSLDRNMQLDGTALVQMMSVSFPSLMISYASPFLAAYVVILSNRSSSRGTVSDANNKKRSRNNNKATGTNSKSDPTKYQALQSLLALLKTGNAKKRKSGNKSARGDDTDITIVNDARGTNALFIPGPATGPILLKPCGLHDLTSYTQSQSKSFIAAHELGRGFELHPTTVCDLLGKLRDAFAEATSADKGIPDLQEVLLILESAHLLYKAFCRTCTKDPTDTTKGRLDKVWSQYSTLLMGIFPVSSASLESATATSISTSAHHLVEEVNLELCVTILDAHLVGDNAEKDHLGQVLKFLFAELESLRDSLSQSESEETIVDKSSDAFFGALEVLLLISRKEQNAETATVSGVFHKLVKALAASFFSDELTVAGSETAKAFVSSRAVRQCVLLTREIFIQCDWDIQHADGRFGPALNQILRGLCGFLSAWGNHFVYETIEVITMLDLVVRRLDVTTTSPNESRLVDHIRSSLVPLVKHKKKTGATFVGFPVKLQRKIIGLIVMLQTPAPAMLDGLCKICAQCWGEARDDTVSTDIGFLIVRSVHSIKKTIPMKNYLGFITKCMGIDQKPFAKLQHEVNSVSASNILRFDACTDLVGHILCQCGPSKVLPMLCPLLSQWLYMKQESGPTAEEILTARATLSILSPCTANFEDCEMSVLDTIPELKEPALMAICIMLKHLPSSGHGGAKFELEETELGMFLEPLIVLFRHEKRLLQDCFAGVSCGVKGLASSDQTKLVSALLVISKDVRLASKLRGSEEIVEYSKAIEEALSPGSAEQLKLARLLRTSLEVHCGEVKSTTVAR